MSKTNTGRIQKLNCEQEAKFIQDRISSTEKHFAELCHAFGQYSRKTARLRDKGDELATVTSKYAESEGINKSLSNSLYNFSTYISTISSYGDLRVQNIDNKVVASLSQYEISCKQTKEEVKQIYNMRDKELQKKKQLDRIKDRNPRNRQLIVKAEAELVKATAEVTKTVRSLEEQITVFEKQKINDIKNILLDFISIEMGYHSRALELLTKAYQVVDDVNEEMDMQEFKESLHTNEIIPHTSMKQSLFRATQSLGSLNTLFLSPQKGRVPGIPKAKNSKSRSEETLDSLKRSISETEDSQNEENFSDNNTIDEDSSSVVIKKFVN